MAIFKTNPVQKRTEWTPFDRNYIIRCRNKSSQLELLDKYFKETVRLPLRKDYEIASRQHIKAS
ncbi:hypothetical protein CU097_001242, partial [Rhizopus azygosporus]